MRVLFVEQPREMPPAPEGRAVVVDVAFASGDAYETSTLPFLNALGDRLALWIDHHEHPIGWDKVRGDPRFLLVPNREAHACPELVTPEVVARLGKIDVVVAHADFDGLLSAVKVLRLGEPPWPQADEDARAADSPGRGHVMTERARLYVDALSEVQASLHTKQREDVRQALVAALVQSPDSLPIPLEEQLRELQADHLKTIAPAIELAKSAKEEAQGVLVVRAAKAMPKSLKKALLSELEARAAVGVVIEGKAITAATFREEIDLARVQALGGGRSDYRFGTTTDGGREIVAALGRVVKDG
ncbi:MAG: hypothetical protein JST92_03475 [Deltaproteobacteria bacterium]|nr:hypothetical protein [Deltaproteobacteria bacterium]